MWLLSQLICTCQLVKRQSVKFTLYTRKVLNSDFWQMSTEYQQQSLEQSNEPHLQLLTRETITTHYKETMLVAIQINYIMIDVQILEKCKFRE